MDQQAVIDIDRELDKTKSKVFLESNTAFLGSIMCSLEFKWDDSIPTASVNGIHMKWNPKWFISLPEATRKTVLVHELWHVAKLHFVRQGNRKHTEWNQACDISINNGLEDDGYTFQGTVPWLNQDYSGLSEEQIYEKLVDSEEEQNKSPWLADPKEEENDIEEITSQQKQETVNVVVKAIQTAKMLKQWSDSIGKVEELVNTFLKPVIPWQTLLYNFFSSMISDIVSWSRPNRRYQDMYLPSKREDDTMLKNLHYYFDVSGSVTRREVERFNTELLYIKQMFNPEKITLVQFDTQISDVRVIEQNEDFDGLVVHGRGGTNLKAVRNHIHETKPTAVIIFSDLVCKPMQELDYRVPVIWIVVGNTKANPSFGTVIHLKE